MNKNIFSIKALLLFCLLGLNSCDDKLDINPRQSIDSGTVFTTAANLEAALLGAYTEIKGTFGVNVGGELYGGDFNLMSELLAEDGNLVWGGSFSTYREMFDRALATDNVIVRDNWIRAYGAIDNVNNVLANLEVATDPDFRAQIEGEARTVRAMMYFNLVRFYAKPYGAGSEASDPGVPMVVNPILTDKDADATSSLGRSTVAEVYDLILADLTKAKALLGNAGGNGFRLSTYAASALLSRVYLQMGNYGAAAQEADAVLASGIYELSVDPLAAFNNSANVTEDVFAIQQTALSNAGSSNAGLTTFYARLNGNGRGDLQVQPAHLDIYEDGDLRGGLAEDLASTAVITDVSDLYYLGVGGQNSGFIQTAKYGDANLNIPIVRLAEMYLTRAEANMVAGTTVGDTPLNDINAIRARAGLSALTAVDIDEIKLERKRELAFEGFALHDLKRWKGEAAGFAWNAPELVLPIPEREREVYDIPQNDGY